MRHSLMRTLQHPLVALAATVLGGLVEFAALWRSRWAHRAARNGRTRSAET
jgi:hypothetical protein